MKDKVELLKKQFPKGTWIELHHMEGEPHMVEGLKGIITHVDDYEQIHVEWENGSHLALNLDVDSFRLISLHVIENYSLLNVTPIKFDVNQEKVSVEHIIVLSAFDYQFFEKNIIRSHAFIKKINTYFKDRCNKNLPFIITHDMDTGLIVHSTGCDYVKKYSIIKDLNHYLEERND